MIWESVGPILLLQFVVVFIVLGWPALKSASHATGRWLGRLFPVEPELDDVSEAASGPYRGKWRDASHQGAGDGPKHNRSDEHTRCSSAQAAPATRARDAYLRCLGLSGEVNRSELKRAYRHRAKALHPDRLSYGNHTQAEHDHAVAQMQALNEAYEWLMANP